MKKLFGTLMVLAMVVAFAPSAGAIPILQLDIVGGSYNTTTETTVSNGSQFTLIALVQGYSDSTIPSLYLSAAVIPKLSGTGTGPDLGSFLWNAETVHVTSDMTYGVPPLKTLLGGDPLCDKGDLSKHGVFYTYYHEFALPTFGWVGVTHYNVVNPNDSDNGEETMHAYYVSINTSALSAGYQIHFDLYNKKALPGTTDLDLPNGPGAFAPFSHDAESGPCTTQGGCTPVPEPASMLLLGSGLLGAGFFRRRRK